MQSEYSSLILEETYRSSSRRLFARLVRVLGDFDLAEDALQDAVRAAAIQWREKGVPDSPEAWLFQVARNYGISMMRKERKLLPLNDQHFAEFEPPSEFGDELLRLAFLCCHPAISPDAQVALTLREVCELTTEEIAAAYLVPTQTIAQRIVRAKSKIRAAQIPFELPSPDELPARFDAVLKTIYLVFNESYASSTGKAIVRQDLMSLAIHLGRQLFALSLEPEAGGLLALMLIHQARNNTRATPDGDLILLEHQDRRLWNRQTLDEASILITSSFSSGRAGPYSVQAAIASVYADAPSFSETDWDEIIGLYDLLFRLEPSPVVILNHAVAIAMRDGPEAGIQRIDRLLSSGVLSGYHRAYAARGELHWRRGNTAGALADFERALEIVRQEPEKRYLIQRIAEISNVGVDLPNSRATTSRGQSKTGP